MNGALVRLTLARPKANLVDAAMIAALHGAFVAYRGHPGLRGVLLGAEGPHFSFGASVEEHLPDQCAAMLASLHSLILAMVEFPAPIHHSKTMLIDPKSGEPTRVRRRRDADGTVERIAVKSGQPIPRSR